MPGDSVSHTRRDHLATLIGLAFAGAGGTAMQPASAQSFPNRPVRITTPFPAGSGPDVALRLVAEQLAKTWGKPVVVENKPGGNGFIAMAAFKQGSSDGHDLIQLDSNHTTTHPHTYANLPYDVEKDLVPLRMILRAYFFVTVAGDSRYRSLDDIVLAARASPGKVTYGSWFNGSPGHLGALRLQSMSGVQMSHIPYRDFGQLYAAVANKEVDWALGSVASAGALERAGKLRFIEFAAPAREPQYPTIPTTGESPGARGFEVSAWAGIFGPRKLAPLLLDRISADIAEALAATPVIARYKALGYEAPDLGPGAFADLMRRETVAWRDTIRAANLKLD